MLRSNAAEARPREIEQLVACQHVLQPFDESY